MLLINIKLNKCAIKLFQKNSGTKSVPDCYKNQEMCNKAVDNYPHTLGFVPEGYKT